MNQPLVDFKAFRLKDFIATMTNKEHDCVQIYYKNVEIDYDCVADYKDKYVVGICIGDEDGTPCIILQLDDTIEIIQIPYIPDNEDDSNET